MKKKLCFFNVHLRIGGVEKQLSYVINRLSKDKYDISLLLCKKEGDILGEISQDIKIKDLLIEYSSINKIFIAYKLFFMLLKNKPDVLICFHSKLFIISVLVCKLLGIKVVCRFPGYFYKGRLNFIREIYIRFVKKIIAVSDGVKDSLLKSLKDIDKNRIVVIRVGIDYKKILELSNRPVNETLFLDNLPIIASVGRLTKGKRFDILIKSLQLVQKKCNILIIGDGPNRSSLENLSRDLGLDKRINFLGLKNNPYKYLRKATLFVLTSESEGLPGVLLEAKALEIPCICANYLGGTQEIIEHNNNGYIIRKNDEKELALAIDLLLNDADKRRKFREEGLKQIQNDYNIERSIKQYEKVVDEII